MPGAAAALPGPAGAGRARHQARADAVQAFLPDRELAGLDALVQGGPFHRARGKRASVGR